MESNMKEVFVICNQQGEFLGKQGQWLDESEPSAAWRSLHRDVALNHMIEINAREIDQRLVLLQCPLNEKDVPLLGDAVPARKSAPVTFDEPEVVVADADDAENGSMESDGQDKEENDNLDDAQPLSDEDSIASGNAQ